MTYEGHFKNGLKHGKGVQTSKDKKYRYEGDWVEAFKEGFGIPL
jgi:hypothetical protein